LFGNWVRELEERTNLHVHLLHGQARDAALQDWIDVGGIAVTSYATLLSLRGVNRHPIHLLIADEAHYIKIQMPGGHKTFGDWHK